MLVTFGMLIDFNNHNQRVRALSPLRRLPGRNASRLLGFDGPPKLAAIVATEDLALGHYRRVRDEIRWFVSEKLESLAHC